MNGFVERGAGSMVMYAGDVEEGTISQVSPAVSQEKPYKIASCLRISVEVWFDTL